MPRFDRDARQTFRSARTAAVEAGVPVVDTEHLVHALFERDGAAARRLTGDTIDLDALRAGFARARRRGGVSDAEADLLGRLGVDVETITSRIEEEFGDHALEPPATVRGRGGRDLSGELRRVLIGALDEARELRSRRIGDEHLLLSTLRRPGVAADVLDALGVSYLDVRSRVAVG